MHEPADQKRKKIVHDFAKWTALSALRSGSPLKRAKRVYDLIENHGNLPLLFSTDHAIDETEFDRWHEQVVLDFVSAEPALKINSQVGWAAKIVNIYLKTRVYLGGEGRTGLASVIHPPIDSGLQRGLKKEFPNRPWKIKRIKEICSYQDDYLPFIQDFRSIAKGKRCLLIELEVYWLGAK